MDQNILCDRFSVAFFMRVYIAQIVVKSIRLVACLLVVAACLPVLLLCCVVLCHQEMPCIYRISP